jgi:hypothetical protein
MSASSARPPQTPKGPNFAIGGAAPLYPPPNAPRVSLHSPQLSATSRSSYHDHRRGPNYAIGGRAPLYSVPINAPRVPLQRSSVSPYSLNSAQSQQRGPNFAIGGAAPLYPIRRNPSPFPVPTYREASHDDPELPTYAEATGCSAAVRPRGRSTAQPIHLANDRSPRDYFLYDDAADHKILVTGPQRGAWVVDPLVPPSQQGNGYSLVLHTGRTSQGAIIAAASFGELHGFTLCLGHPDRPQEERHIAVYPGRRPLFPELVELVLPTPDGDRRHIQFHYQHGGGLRSTTYRIQDDAGARIGEYKWDGEHQGYAVNLEPLAITRLDERGEMFLWLVAACLMCLELKYNLDAAPAYSEPIGEAARASVDSREFHVDLQFGYRNPGG